MRAAMKSLTWKCFELFIYLSLWLFAHTYSFSGFEHVQEKALFTPAEVRPGHHGVHPSAIVVSWESGVGGGGFQCFWEMVWV